MRLKKSRETNTKSERMPMRYLITVPCLALAGIFLCGCTSYDKIIAEERRQHPPIIIASYAPDYLPPAASKDDSLLPDIIIVIPPPVTDNSQIPTAASTAAVAAPFVNDESDWNVKITRKWTHVVIHHSASDKGSAQMFDRYHTSRGWSGGLAYDFVIGNGTESGDGEIEVGKRWKEQLRGAHAGVDYYNEHGIGICLVGNFEDGRPTKAQIDALVMLIRSLQNKCDISARNVVGHRDIKDTLCPGKNFPMDDVRSRIRR
jgi:hypothetical protein